LGLSQELLQQQEEFVHTSPNLFENFY